MRGRRTCALLAASMVCAVLSGCEDTPRPSRSAASPVPTVGAGGRTVCGVVPARAITLAVGTSRWKADVRQEPMSRSDSTPQACYVSGVGSPATRLLVVEKAKQADPAATRAEIDRQIAGGGERLPSDIAGHGYLFEQSAHEVQTRLLIGDDQVQIYLLEGGAGRDSRADALNLTRLLVPLLT